MNTKDLYLNLLRDTLTGHTYNDVCILPYYPLRRFLKKFFPKLHIGRRLPISSNRNDQWQLNAHTMVGKKRLDNLKFCIEDILKNNIEGAIVECGVWRGGASMFARGVLEANDAYRWLYMYDSFKGLPKSTMLQDLVFDYRHVNDYLGVSQYEVYKAFRQYGFSLWNTVCKAGWFRDTLPKHDCPIAVLRADGDMYESTWDILYNLYPQVSKGGYIIIDDYMIDTCKQAVQDYFGRIGQTMPTLISIDADEKEGGAVYFQKQ